MKERGGKTLLDSILITAIIAVGLGWSYFIYRFATSGVGDNTTSPSHRSSDISFNVNQAQNDSFWIYNGGNLEAVDLGNGSIQWSVQVKLSQNKSIPNLYSWLPAIGATVSAEVRDSLGPATTTTQKISATTDSTGTANLTITKPSKEVYLYVTNISGKGYTWATADKENWTKDRAYTNGGGSSVGSNLKLISPR